MEVSAQTAPLEVGSDFAGRYRVLRCLDQGGMGSVYEVLDQRTDRLRALKVMLPQIAADPDMRERFLREASVVGRVRSDHIVEVVDAGIAEPSATPFLVMDLLRGDDLGGLLAQRERLEPELAVTLLTQVALGLDKVHDEGVIHRDLKPENLFVTTRDDGSQCVKILDFGVAKVTRDFTTLRTTRSLGTPLYMAPEQLTGDGTIDTTADLYALAHVAFCLLVGKPYWSEEADRASNAYAFISTVARGVVEPASTRAARLGVTLSPAFDKWFARAAAKRVSKRFSSASEQVAALAAALELPSPSDATLVAAYPPPSSNKPVPALVAVGCVLALGAAFLWQGGEDDDVAAARPALTAPAPRPETLETATTVRPPPTVAPKPLPPPAPSSSTPPRPPSPRRVPGTSPAPPPAASHDPLDDL